MEDNLIRALSKNLKASELDLRNQGLTDITMLCKKVFIKMDNLKILNLSENKIKTLPRDMMDYFQYLETLNLNNNRLDDIFNAVDCLCQLPSLKSLFINLNKEEQVDYILKQLPQLEHLNGLPVDRDELFDDEEDYDKNQSEEQVEYQETSQSQQDNDIPGQNLPLQMGNSQQIKDFVIDSNMQAVLEKTDKLNGLQFMDEGSQRIMNPRQDTMNRGFNQQHHQQDLEENEEQDLIHPDEFEQIAEIYDAIRVLNQKINPQKDSQLAMDFDLKLKNVMEELSDTVNNPMLNKHLKLEQALKSKGELYKVCSEKITNFFYQCHQQNFGYQNKDSLQIANVLDKVFSGYQLIMDQLAKGFKQVSISNDIKSQELAKNQQEAQQLLEAAEHLENMNNNNVIRIEACEKEKQELMVQIQNLEEENKKYLETLIKHSKTSDTKKIETQQRDLSENNIKRFTQSPSPQPFGNRPITGGNNSSRKNEKQTLLTHRVSQSNTGLNITPVQQKQEPFHLRNSSENKTSSINTSSYHLNQSHKKKTQFKHLGLHGVVGPTQTRSLTQKQLKDLINDMYTQKTKFDQKCEENKQPKETMEQYMYTYLNQRYGLKNLIIEWAAAIITGIKNFSKDDHEIALFGKILRNECDEEFRFIQATVKETIFALLKTLYREKYTSKSEESLQQLLEQTVNGNIENVLWKKIIERMYDENDYQQLEQQIFLKIQQLKSDPYQMQLSNEKKKNKKFTRAEIIQLMNDGHGRVKFAVFMKVVLDFQLREHEKFLAKLLQEFKQIDNDHDGILNEEEFRMLIANLEIAENLCEKFLQIIDPYNNQRITFSECIHLLSSEMINDENGQEIAILEKIAMQ